MAYNLSLINGSGMVPLVQTVNDNLMFGWLGNLALITLFLMMFFGFIRSTNNAKKSLQYSSILIAIAAMMFRTMNLIPDLTVLITWAFAAIVAALAFMTPD